jgi:hypothetical protein
MHPLPKKIKSKENIIGVHSYILRSHTKFHEKVTFFVICAKKTIFSALNSFSPVFFNVFYTTHTKCLLYANIACPDVNIDYFQFLKIFKMYFYDRCIWIEPIKTTCLFLPPWKLGYLREHILIRREKNKNKKRCPLWSLLFLLNKYFGRCRLLTPVKNIPPQF